MYDFRIMLAEVPVRIRCVHPETFEFLRPYETSVEESFSVEPTKADLLRMRESLRHAAEREGHAGPPERDAYLERYAVHALLAEKLVGYDVLLMHGSALCMDGQAYVFTAKSDTGKSTHARLWREVFADRVWMINDDKPMLRIKPDGVTVWGTPWTGKHRLGRNAGAPLKAVTELRRGTRNHIEPMSKTDAFPLLLRQTYASADPAVSVRILELEKRLLDAAEFYSLCCNMEPEAALVAWKGMNPGSCSEVSRAQLIP